MTDHDEREAIYMSFCTILLIERATLSEFAHSQLRAWVSGAVSIDVARLNIVQHRQRSN
ncbi:hypothetical protein HNR60_001718 [Rhodopseudomonas rhenobacensis]|uniref:Uncharacterized protein n=1 Tax=Rhodopseudomonas rhenobacensis TaxID=87461 RepID=A0A7W8DY71_9BRAD|nr:hypothetical protein [Rhodopseudomonas rhenobacensis]MBB5046969.1 hypothetical protein [Rhodopseudomonas rhenobacensis]